MALTLFLLAGYLWVGLLFFDQTYREGEHTGWDVARVTGLALCAVWPAVLIYVIVASYRARHSN